MADNQVAVGGDIIGMDTVDSSSEKLISEISYSPSASGDNKAEVQEITADLDVNVDEKGQGSETKNDKEAVNSDLTDPQEDVVDVMATENPLVAKEDEIVENESIIGKESCDVVPKQIDTVIDDMESQEDTNAEEETSADFNNSIRENICEEDKVVEEITDAREEAFVESETVDETQTDAEALQSTGEVELTEVDDPGDIDTFTEASHANNITESEGGSNVDASDAVLLENRAQEHLTTGDGEVMAVKSNDIEDELTNQPSSEDGVTSEIYTAVDSVVANDDVSALEDEQIIKDTIESNAAVSNEETDKDMAEEKLENDNSEAEQALDVSSRECDNVNDDISCNDTAEDEVEKEIDIQKDKHQIDENEIKDIQVENQNVIDEDDILELSLVNERSELNVAFEEGFDQKEGKENEEDVMNEEELLKPETTENKGESLDLDSSDDKNATAGDEQMVVDAPEEIANPAEPDTSVEDMDTSMEPVPVAMETETTESEEKEEDTLEETADKSKEVSHDKPVKQTSVEKESQMEVDADEMTGDKTEEVEAKTPEVDSENKSEISESEPKVSLKSEVKPAAEAKPAIDEIKPPKTETGSSPSETTADSDNSSPKTPDVSPVKIKQENKNTTVTEAKSEDSDADKTDSDMGLKIVGVTSAVGYEDKTEKVDDSTVKTDDSSDLGLKISAVSGAEDTKANVASDKTVKQESLTAKNESSTKSEDKDKQKKVKKEAAAKQDDDDDVITLKEEKKPPTKPKQSSKIQKCIVCAKVGKCKYNIVRNGDVKHLCDDTCFKRFRSNPTTYLRQAENKSQDSTTKNGNQSTVAGTPKTPPVAAAAPVKNAGPQTGQQVYKTCTVCQLMNVRTSKPFLNWQGLDFCGEECLGKFQAGLSVTCSYCSSQIHQNNKAKYCCRVGTDVKHFCSLTCNNEFVKRMKLCAFCNKDLAQLVDSFMAPVGNQGTFKDFCSQVCLQKFEDKNSKDLEIVGVQKGQKTPNAPKGNFCCAVCSKVGPVKHEFKLEGKVNRLCSDPCYSAFQYANKLTMNTCDNCGTSCYNEGQAPQYIQYEGQQKRFCTFMCVNTFRNTNKKTVPCGWCGSKKSNFDMIERVDANNKYQLFCSLNCLSLYRVNLQATSNQAVLCDQCRKFVPAQYHLTMSDASVRNFCSYGCVMQFQAQFQTSAKQVQPPAVTTAKQMTTPPATQQTTTTRSGRMVTRGVTAQQKQPTPQPTRASARTNRSTASTDSFPIISNVVSLAPQGNQQQINIKTTTPVTVTGQQQGIKTTTTTTGNQTVQQQIIIQPPPPKSVKNKSMLCKPFVQTKATSCRPHTQTKETQTDGKVEPDKFLVPVPVPLYTPTPLAMYSMPTPILIPVPVPIPIPVFIPTTKKSSASILKQIKEIQDKIPADPLEAELLMMAEAVAGKDSESSSDSEDGGELEAPPVPIKEATPTPAGAGGGDLGEDMLQMALRMASEMSDEPVMDLETSLEPVAVNTIPPPQPMSVPKMDQPEEDDDDLIPPSSRTRRGRGGGNKRQSRGTPRRNPKRQRTDIQPDYQVATPSPPPPTAPPPDANFHLKYTYGVNAFKHWVIQKNVQIEQASKPGLGKPLKTYKTDILQCTADELNFSLCLFVKEVRKPNGEEYAVDSIFYLCLGIQQYLFESGRIDNIFTDIYYERFTECLNELLTRYEPKLNHAGQLVCRIEEEHLWESKQLGAHSPHVLLNSLVYFNTKYFMLKTSEDHLKLSFTHIMKHWKKTPSGRGSGTGPNAGRSVYLRYYCPTPQGKDANAQKKKKEEMPVYEQTENLDNPLRCPVKLYEFYLSKCPESIKNRNDTFYLVPERSCVPDSPVWYSTAMLGIDQMAKMLNRVRLVREIQEAHLHTQPIYI